MDGEGAAHAGFADAAREDGVVAGVVDGVGDAGEGGGDEQDGVVGEDPDHGEGGAAEQQAGEEDLAGAEAVDGVAHRRLHQGGDDVVDGQRQAELDVADAEGGLEQREQRRQHEHVDVADQVGGADGGEGAEFLAIHATAR